MNRVLNQRQPEIRILERYRMASKRMETTKSSNRMGMNQTLVLERLKTRWAKLLHLTQGMRRRAPEKPP